MNITIDKTAGFCWGVVRTIDIAEETLAEGIKLYSLGDVIHNPQEIERLAEQGMTTISQNNFDTVAREGASVLIRAHGEPPSTYERAKELGVNIIDATCPVVTKLQERIRKFHRDDYQIIIFGKKDHAEVIGLRGVCNDEAIVVKTVEEALTSVDFARKTVLFSQTTMDKPTFYAIRDALKEKMKDLIVESFEELATEFHAKDTICGQVSGREKKLREFAEAQDIVIFVAGRASSNGKVLFDIAHSANPNTFFVERAEEIQASWFTNTINVGISGATSTPQWLMEEVKKKIERLTTH